MKYENIRHDYENGQHAQQRSRVPATSAECTASKAVIKNKQVDLGDRKVT